MRFKTYIAIISGLFFSIYSFSQTGFISPLKIPLSLSASFGEIRPDHYHSGIDIKTEGVTGKEVVASADGYVYLILVSPVGFGKAIFLRHPSGYSTVYGHLDSYSPEIEEYVKLQQYKFKTYAISITPPPDRLPVKQGQLIGFSGNTGGSTGPHLHFEVRKSVGEKPVDPLKFGFGIKDDIKPTFSRLVVYPATRNTTINGGHSRLLFSVEGADGLYHLPGDTEISINGTAGFGFTAFDNINDMPNRFGISSVDLKIDSLPWFTYDAGEFSFSETRYVNAHIDYELMIKSNIEIEKTFVLPGDRLSLYQSYMNNGLFDFSDSKIHNIKIIVKDSKGNPATLAFKIYPALPGKARDSVFSANVKKVMPFSKENTFVSDGIRLTIPAGTLYDTIRFTYSCKNGNGNLLSPVHRIHDRYTPLHKAARVSIKPDTVPAGLESKLVIVQIDEKGTLSSIGGAYENGYISADIRNFGSYAVTIDTIPPLIYANGFSDGSDFTNRSSIRINITDNLSGIKTYTGTIDGNWALFEYDAKNNLIFYKPDPQRLKKGIKHRLAISVTDNCNNSTLLTRDFTW